MDASLSTIESAERPKDAGVSRLPPEKPLAMPEQSFTRYPVDLRLEPKTGDWLPRFALFCGAAAVTVAFAVELHSVLSFVRLTPIQLVFLVLSTLAFGWIALGSLSAALGFLPLFAGEPADTVRLPATGETPHARTALLFPIYHEDPASIAGAIEALSDDLAAHGGGRAFDVFVLSDSRSEQNGRLEEQVFAALAARLAGRTDVYYRRRLQNTSKKAGNIKDWVERFGAAYETFIILDADSVMSGETVVRLALAMQRDPGVGLIQTVPRLVGGHTLFQMLHEYASGIYGPTVAAGIAGWHRHQGNYWGHNAIIRTRAFADAAGLPPLPGRPPFGGDIRSHDFVEAVLLQRAGWEVHMVPTVAGSYEGAPPGLAELIVRDRRWAQGNLQHLALLPARGLTWMGRIHLAMGAFAYLVSAVWAASLIVGLVLALQGQHIIPSYFQDSKTLFPIWPEIDPGAAFRLFLVTMFVVLLPKLLGLILEIKRAEVAGERFAAVLTVVAVAVETVFSMLFAPILMVTQTVAVVQILSGRDSGWNPQRRSADGIPLWDAIVFCRWHVVIGVVATAVCWVAASSLIGWMAPILLGLVLAPILAWATSKRAASVWAVVLATPERRRPPAIITATLQRIDDWSRRVAEGRLTEAGDMPKAA